MNLSILSRTKQTGKKKGCVIFDDLMSKLSECGLLFDLFSKYSSHYDLTTIHIMQNILFKAGGKHGSDHVTIYQNMHVLVLFKNPLDNTVIHTIAQCISRGKKYGELVDILHMNSGDMIQIEAPDFDPDIDDISPTTLDQELNNQLTQGTTSPTPKSTELETECITPAPSNHHKALQEMDWPDAIPVEIPSQIDQTNDQRIELNGPNVIQN